MFRRGVSTMIGVGVPSFQFNEINGLKGSRRRRWGAFFDQHSQTTKYSSSHCESLGVSINVVDP